MIESRDRLREGLLEERLDFAAAAAAAADSRSSAIEPTGTA